MLLQSLLVFFALPFLATCDSQSYTQWSGWGANSYNNRWAAGDTLISSSNIKSIVPQCNVSYPIGVSATPVVSGNTIYYPTWDGSFAALDFVSCRILWSINVTQIIVDYAPITSLQAGSLKAVSRTSPQIDGNTLYFGTQIHALVVAVNRLTGQVLGTVQVNGHPFAVITMSPTFFEGKLFIGASSLEEAAALLPSSTYKCCSFAGNMVALTFSGTKFDVLWNISMIPPSQVSQGWSGASLWGSQPPIDPKSRQIFIATGNTYSVPQVITDCQLDTQNITAVMQGLVPDSCLPANIWQESVLAIDIDLGIVNWIHQLPALDAWTAACIDPTSQNAASCPTDPGPDADFGMAPTFVPGSASTPYGKDILVLGQKNGNLYAFSAQAGTILWTTVTSPDGTSGGLSWGLAVDDSRVYFTAINSLNREWTLQPSGQVTNLSAYGAASLLTGQLLWEVLVPGNGVAYGPPSIVGDLVLVVKTGTDNGTGDFDTTQGALLALQKQTGDMLLDYELSANSHGGVAVQGEYILFGSGYGGFTPPIGIPGAINVLKVG